MSDKTDKLVNELSELTVLEMAELKKALEEKWGVEAVAAAPVAAAPAAAAEEAVEESTEFEVTLTEVPAPKKIAIIKIVRELTSLGLKEAKEMVEGAPKVLKESVSKAEADEIVKKIEDAGGKATAKGL
ncbi:MAG: 50S ribosomal protein L7/L12 [Chlamydiota bacterium]